MAANPLSIDRKSLLDLMFLFLSNPPDPVLEFRYVVDSNVCAGISPDSSRIDYYISAIESYGNSTAKANEKSRTDILAQTNNVLKYFKEAKETSSDILFCGKPGQTSFQDLPRPNVGEIAKIYEVFDLGDNPMMAMLKEQIVAGRYSMNSDTLVIVWPDFHNSININKQFTNMAYRLLIDRDTEVRLAFEGRIVKNEIAPDLKDFYSMTRKETTEIVRKIRDLVIASADPSVNLFFDELLKSSDFVSSVLQEGCVLENICAPNNLFLYLSLVPYVSDTILNSLVPSAKNNYTTMEDANLYEEQVKLVDKGDFDMALMDKRSTAAAMKLAEEIIETGKGRSKKTVILVKFGAGHVELFTDVLIKNSTASVIVFSPLQFAAANYKIDIPTLPEGIKLPTTVNGKVDEAKKMP